MPEEIYMPDRAAWRRWLTDNWERSPGIWLVYDKGRDRRLPYDDIVEEALAFGWVDSRPSALSDTQAKLYVAPRKAKSSWSAKNKRHVEELTAKGLMQPGGLAVVAEAQRLGTWAALDDVEKLLEPDDLQAMLDADQTARTNWDGFPRSAKRAILEWIGGAKKPETRAARIRKTVDEAHEGRRANQWRQPKE